MTNFEVERPVIPIRPDLANEIISYCHSLETDRSSQFWERRRLEQTVEVRPNLGAEVHGLYQAPAKPSGSAYDRVFPRNFIPIPKHRHRIYSYLERREVRDGLQDAHLDKLSKIFGQYDLAKACYVADTLQTYGRGRSKLLEIGGGIGLVGGILEARRIADFTYTNVDLPEMLASAGIFACWDSEIFTFTRESEGFSVGTRHFVSNSGVSVLTEFDLGVNVTSFQEMDEQQINHYMAVLERVMSPGAVFVSINRRRKVREQDNLRFFHQDVPWPSRFRLVHRSEAPFSRWSGRKIIIETHVFEID